jgi:SAM-dependent methyltransferase
MKKIYDIISAYGFFLFKLLFYEAVYIFMGYRGNKFNIRNDKKVTDNIPCSYLFLSQIVNYFKKNKINSFVDLGCGNGRAIDFFNKKLNIKCFGIELYQENFKECENLFKNDANVTILNKNFFTFDFNQNKFDCYFMNDPLQTKEDSNKLIEMIMLSRKNDSQPFYFVLSNFNKSKREYFAKFELVKSFEVGNRGYWIFIPNN